MGVTESKYNFILSAEDRAGAVFDQLHGRLNIFEQGMHSLEGSLLSATTGLSGFGAVAASAVVTVSGIAAGILELARSTSEYEDHLTHLSDKLGVTTEFLSKMQYVAKMEDIAPENMEKGLQKLEISIGQTTSGLSTMNSTAKKAFDQLGVSITNSNGSAKTSEQIMLDLADAFGKQTDSSKKAALAASIFGRRNIEMVQVLGKGRDALQAYYDEAENHGLVVTEEAARRASEFDDKIKSLEATFKGLSMTIGNSAIPYLNKYMSETDTWIQKMREARKEGSLWNQFLHSLDNTGDIFQPTAVDKKFNQADFARTLSEMGKGQSAAKEASDSGPASAAQVKASDALINYIMQSAPKEEQELYKVAEEAQKVADALVKAGQDPQPVWDEMNKRLEAVHQTFDNMQKTADMSFEDYNSMLKKIVEMTGEGADELAKSNKEMELINYGKVLDEMKAAGDENTYLWKTVSEQYDEANTQYQEGIYTLGGLKMAQDDAAQSAVDMGNKTVDAANKMASSMSNALAIIGINAGNPSMGYGPQVAGTLFPGIGGDSPLFDTSAQLFPSHAAGLRRVPYDNYIAKLHKNEEILRADDPRNINNPRAGGSIGATITGTVININGYNKDPEQLAKEIDAHLAKMADGSRSQFAATLAKR